jgi:hypothetical protein
MHSPARLILPFLLAAAMAQVASGQTPSPDSLGAARDLYASARYDEALAVLNDLRPTEAPGTPATDLKSIEQYRSLCLLALGRGDEAETAIAAVITADPSYQPNDVDASPRVRAAFSDVRKKVLPDIATKRYADAKASFDRKEYAHAVLQFKQALTLIDDPDMGGRMADLRTLAAGFLDLSIAAVTPPEPPKPAPVAAPAPPPPPPVPVPDPNRIYTAADADDARTGAQPRRRRGGDRRAGTRHADRDSRVGAPDVRRGAADQGPRLEVPAGDDERQAREIPQADSAERQPRGIAPIPPRGRLNHVNCAAVC